MNTKKMEENLRIKPAIEAMQVGDDIPFPLEKLGSVKTTACTSGLVLNRRYKTKVNRAGRVVSVIRVS